jgi:hypothetical protein
MNARCINQIKNSSSVSYTIQDNMCYNKPVILKKNESECVNWNFQQMNMTQHTAVSTVPLPWLCLHEE